jgi:hypothetical protein
MNLVSRSGKISGPWLRRQLARCIEAGDISSCMEKYFYGRPIGDLLVETTQLLADNAGLCKMTVRPVKLNPSKLWWEFFWGDLKICTVKYESSENDSSCKVAWLEWYLVEEHWFFQDMYLASFGYPEWVKTKKDEEEFFKAG